MLSVLVWLAMWGQVQTSNCELLKSDHVVCSDFRLVKPPKPAEHVIEIKTVREHPDHEVSDWRECGADDEVVLANAAINGIFAVICRSTKVTRELWIDGVRWGVVKGLE